MEPHNAAEQPSTTDPHDGDDSSTPNSDHLTRQELIQRRASRLSQLTKCYRDHYWMLMEDVRRKHREFLWKFGNDTCKNSVVYADNANNKLMKSGRALSDDDDNGLLNRCGFPNCRFKAMALTRYCNAHILSDSNQVLYIGCQFAHRCGEDPLLCGKPVLRSSIPSLCPTHIKLSENNIRKALKKNGASVTVSNKLGSKFHLVLTEYVRLIQSRRRVRKVESINALNDK